jgi:hypothetical protein
LVKDDHLLCPGPAADDANGAQEFHPVGVDAGFGGRVADQRRENVGVATTTTNVGWMAPGQLSQPHREQRQTHGYPGHVLWTRRAVVS